MNKVKIKVKKLHKDAKIPSYAHSGDAGLDLYSIEDVLVPPGEIRKIKTGIALSIPNGYVGLCWDKSGLSMNNGIKTLGGVIDSGFRGELVLGVINLSDKDYTFKKGHKVMQILIQPVVNADIEVVNDLEKTERNDKGFGSTGK